MSKPKSLREKILGILWWSHLPSLKEILLEMAYPPQKEITGNTILDNSYDRSIVKVKSTATITIPKGLTDEFSCVFRYFQGVTATFQNDAGVTMDAPQGLVYTEFKMSTLFKDGKLEKYILEGEA